MNQQLGPAGSEFYDSVAGYFLGVRPDEERILLDAAHEIDMVERLENAMTEADLFVKGSMGQDAINPLVTELRQHRVTLANLLRRLNIPDEPDEPDEDESESAKMTRSEAGRKAAKARWTV
ncbi:hypothetical protein [Actinopolyspora halophila]|uniref:hypothetical protein n=1 Tax=Actinopolyspora halophila TaxID=1850 RepID=UPI00035FB35D|nr:hypothetical protein [Actinopolyspora halophila]